MKLDLHVHSHYSSNATWRIDAVGSPKQIVGQAVHAGLDGVAVTDHNTIRGALEALKAAKGMKGFIVIPGIEVSSASGHILALGVTRDVPRGLPVAETIEMIHALGGIAVASHPYANFPRHSLGDEIGRNRFDAIEAWNSRVRTALNERAARAAQAHGMPAIANSDAHHWKDVSLSYTNVEGNDPLSAIKKGRVEPVYKRMSPSRYARLFGAKILRNLR
ncbi:MAG: PHP domain-containing protein [Candidatus Aenigmarchaeota archaeon]|nr:PHP domain-containing protein [Candidatus Aenigmarchaeota archaeon]